MPKASSVLIELHRPGVGALLASGEVQDMLDRKAEAVATSARARGVTVNTPTTGEEPVPVETVSAGNSKRARALVVVDHPAALRVEAKHRLLGRALTAARRD